VARQRPPEQRLFNLILALLATNAGLTKAQIMSSVAGYVERADSGEMALDQLFQRDKDQLRDLGIRIDVLDTAGEVGNNQHARYRISREAYELPEQARFSSGELALLGLAAEVWRDGSYSVESRRALTKLKGFGIAPSEPVVGFLPFVRAREAALEPLRRAIERGVMVEFDYRRPEEAVSRRRRVSPLAPIIHDGRWLLLAAEADGTRKTFLLQRILGQVVERREPAIRMAPGEDLALAEELRAYRASNRAVIHVVPGSDAAIRLGNRADTRVLEPGVLEVHWSDLGIFAEELVAMHPEAIVMTAGDLREQVIARLSELAARHG